MGFNAEPECNDPQRFREMPILGLGACRCSKKLMLLLYNTIQLFLHDQWMLENSSCTLPCTLNWHPSPVWHILTKAKPTYQVSVRDSDYGIYGRKIPPNSLQYLYLKIVWRQ